jgi:hypothetical protein
MSQIFPNRNLRNVIEEWVGAHGMPAHSAPPLHYTVPDPELSAAVAAEAVAVAAAALAAAAEVDPFHHLGESDDATAAVDDATNRAVSERLAGIRLALFEARLPAAAVTSRGQPGRPLHTLVKMVRGSRYPGLKAHDRENAAYILRDAVKSRDRGAGGGGGGGRHRTLVDNDVLMDVVPLALDVVGARVWGVGRSV